MFTIHYDTALENKTWNGHDWNTDGALTKEFRKEDLKKECISIFKKIQNEHPAGKERYNALNSVTIIERSLNIYKHKISTFISYKDILANDGIYKERTEKIETAIYDLAMALSTLDNTSVNAFWEIPFNERFADFTYLNQLNENFTSTK